MVENRIVKKALDMYLAGWCKDCKIPYEICANKGVCKAYEEEEEQNKNNEKPV